MFLYKSHEVGGVKKRFLNFIVTSKTEVLQTPSAIEVNLGQGKVVKIFEFLKFLKMFDILKCFEILNFF